MGVLRNWDQCERHSCSLGQGGILIHRDFHSADSTYCRDGSVFGGFLRLLLTINLVFA